MTCNLQRPSIPQMSSAPVSAGWTSCKTDDEGVGGQGVDEGLVHVTFERGYPFLQNR
jgi:hypothetical protein